MASEDTFIHFGQEIANFNDNDFESLTKFKAFFGITPSMCAIIYNRIYHKVCVDYRNFAPNHLLWGLMFLKVYGTEYVMIQLAGTKSRKTYRKWVWTVISYIAGESHDVVSLDFFKN
jgi:hypothetical protein